MTIIAVDRDKELGPHEVDHHAEFFLRSVAGYVDEAMRAIVVDHLGVAALQMIDDAVDGLLVAGDNAGAEQDGVFLPIIAINKRTGQVEGTPEITTRGFAADDPELLRNARDIVVRTLEQSSAEERRDYGVMKDKIRGDLKRFLQKNANRRPLIMPIILEL